MPRKAKPLEQRELEATVRTRHRNKTEGSVIVTVKLIQDCPGLSAEALKKWPIVREVLQKLPVSTDADMLAIQRLAETYAEVLDLQATIKKEGRFYDAPTKEGVIIRAHPAVAMYSDASKRLHSLLTEFGLTPSSRSKVKGPGDGEEKDPLREFL
jgi:P27 family predicted phage terminase small subunit